MREHPEGKRLIAAGRLTPDDSFKDSLVWFDYDAIGEGVWNPGFASDFAEVSETVTDRDPADVAHEEWQYELARDAQLDDEKEDEDDGL